MWNWYIYIYASYTNFWCQFNHDHYNVIQWLYGHNIWYGYDLGTNFWTDFNCIILVWFGELFGRWLIILIIYIQTDLVWQNTIQWPALYVIICILEDAKLMEMWFLTRASSYVFGLQPLVITSLMIITKIGMSRTSSTHDIWYVTKTSFWCRFRIWSQNFNIPSVSCVIA